MTGRIKDVLQAARSSTGEVQETLLEKAYSLIRSWCEVVVEQELFRQVVQRYQPNVMLTKLPEVNGVKLDAAIAVIHPIYEKCCRILDAHSQPLETLSVRPRLDELEDEWKSLCIARDEYKAA